MTDVVGLQERTGEQVAADKTAGSWMHLVMVAGIAVTAEMLVAASIHTPEAGLAAALLSALPALPGLLYGVMPIAVATSVMFTPRSRLRRLIVVGTAVMIVVDVMSPGALVQIGQRWTLTSEGISDTPVYTALTLESVTHNVVYFMDNGMSAIGERADSYPQGHPRSRMIRTVFKASLLLLPLLLTIGVASVLEWMRRRVAFVDEASRRTAMIAVTWALVPGVYWLVYSLAHRARVAALFGDGAIPGIFWPHAVLSAIVFVLWSKLLYEPRSA